MTTPIENPVAMLRSINDHTDIYKGIFLWCPGCEYEREDRKVSGLHLLPISGDGSKRPTWKWNGKLDTVGLEPSILTRTKRPDEFICHSFLRNGVWQFLGDCTHDLKNQFVPMVPLPDWVVRE